MKKLQQRKAKSDHHRTEQFQQISKIEIMDVAQTFKVGFAKSVIFKFSQLINILIKSNHSKGVFRPPIF
ncbi:MAG: hypothetical protein JXR07_06365 [Reichenbachiella sp.]